MLNVEETRSVACVLRITGLRNAPPKTWTSGSVRPAGDHTRLGTTNARNTKKNRLECGLHATQNRHDGGYRARDSSTQPHPSPIPQPHLQTAHLQVQQTRPHRSHQHLLMRRAGTQSGTCGQQQPRLFRGRLPFRPQNQVPLTEMVNARHPPSKQTQTGPP